MLFGEMRVQLFRLSQLLICFVQFTSLQGAIVGLLVSLVVMLWLSIGGMFVIGKYKLNLRWRLPLNETCPAGAGAVSAAAAVDGILFNSTAATSLGESINGTSFASNITASPLFYEMSSSTRNIIDNVTSALPLGE
jgi:hypothetical protein